MSAEPGSAFEALAYPAVRASVESLIGSTSGLCTLVHPDDEMFRYAVDTHRGSRAAGATLYICQGWQIFQAVREAAGAHFGGLERVSSFLDFASGWGRFTRFLVRELDPARVFVSEIDAEAMRFQQQAFGVSTVVSANDPGAFAPDREFSFIFASSFFSHLPARTFAAWARSLFARLAPGGLLLFSTHGSAGSAPVGGAPGTPGIDFRPESETRRLDSAEYGTSYVDERFVRQALAEATGGDAAVAVVRRGLCGHQDLYAVWRSASGDVAGLASAIRPLPRGELDRLAVYPDGRLVMAGWAASGGGAGAPAEVSLRCNGVVLERLAGRARWQFERSRAEFLPDDLILIAAADADRRQNILAMGTLGTHPPQPVA